MNTHIRTLAALSLLLTACVAPAPTTPSNTAVDAVFAEYDKPDSPGCALGVIRDGRLDYARGYGMANLEYGLPLTPQSVFRMASVSKQFTAAAIALLAQDGRIGLDDDVRKYVPELPEFPTPVTIRQLVHHTSGVRDYLTLFALAGARDDDFYTDDEVVAMLARQRALNFPPGSEHLYSNSGYFLLSVIVTRVTGEPLSAYAQEKIFGPLGMSHTHFHDDHTRIVPNRATGYSRKDDGWHIDQTTLDMIGDGGVFTSIEDLVAWDRSFYDGSLGGPALVETLLTPAVLTDGTTIAYAFGLEHGSYRGLKTVEHGGSFVGFRTNIVRFPDEKLSIACLCNLAQADPARLARRVADVVLADRFTEPVPAGAAPPEAVGLAPEELARFVGAYQTATGDVWAIAEREGGLVLDRFSGQPSPLVPVSADELRLANGRGQTMAFDPAPGAPAPRAGGHLASDPPVAFSRVTLVEPGSVRLDDYTGVYASEELATRMLVVRDGDRLFLRHENPFKQAPDDALHATLADTFAVDGRVVRFERDGRQRVRAFRLDAGRVRDLRFVKVGS